MPSTLDFRKVFAQLLARCHLCSRTQVGDVNISNEACLLQPGYRLPPGDRSCLHPSDPQCGDPGDAEVDKEEEEVSSFRSNVLISQTSSEGDPAASRSGSWTARGEFHWAKSHLSPLNDSIKTA